MSRLFADRREAGETLARLLLRRSDLRDPVVLALPRGGVPVGLEIARALEAPLDILIVRKLGLPGQPELAMGAIASGGIRVMNPEVPIEHLAEQEVEGVIEGETRELERRERIYRGDRPPVKVSGRTALLVDDGIATGASMLSAVRAVRTREPHAVVVAVPVAPEEACARLRGEADAVVYAATPEPFYAISLWYDSFPQLTDGEVRDILDRAHAEAPETTPEDRR